MKKAIAVGENLKWSHSGTIPHWARHGNRNRQRQRSVFVFRGTSSKSEKTDSKGSPKASEINCRTSWAQWIWSLLGVQKFRGFNWIQRDSTGFKQQEKCDVSATMRPWGSKRVRNPNWRDMGVGSGIAWSSHMSFHTCHCPCGTTVVQL